MRYLKKKVFLYPETSEPATLQDQNVCPNQQEPVARREEVKRLPVVSPHYSETSHASQETRHTLFESDSESKKKQSKTSSKTVVKNFGKAMCSFASSELALPYYKQITNKGDEFLKGFQFYIKKKKGTVDSIESLRSLLLPSREDGEQMIQYKNIFREISIIFIKYFSVNWIFQGKMAHKQAHLKARFKMLRRVQNPEYFTYFKGFVKEAEGKHA